MHLQTKKILVTGAQGFIGSNLLHYLDKIGSNVETFNLKDGKNITNKAQMTAAVMKNYDVIVHLAGFSGSAESNEQAHKSFEINTIPTVILCDLICKFSPKTKLILSGSRLEYGIPEYSPIDENHPTVPLSLYGHSKLASTQIAIVYSRQKNLNVTVFRTSNVYGPHPITKFSGYNLVNRFIDLAIKDKDLTIFGNGQQERDYIYIDDVMNAFILAIESTKSVGQVYNLGSGKGVKLRDMAKIIIKTIGSGRLKFAKWPNEYKQVETGSYVTNLAKIRNDLGFSPSIKFEQGIKNILKAK